MYVASYIMHKYNLLAILQFLEPETLKHPDQPQPLTSSDDVHPIGNIVVATMIIT